MEISGKSSKVLSKHVKSNGFVQKFVVLQIFGENLLALPHRSPNQTKPPMNLSW